MSSTTIGVALRREVEARAKNRCQYCLLHADDAYFAHHVDHVIAQKHGGQTDADNLAPRCAQCNGHKGSDLASLPSSGRLVALFNPRRQRWSAHEGIIEGGAMVPLFEAGFVTVRLLDINDQARVEMGATLAQHPFYPRR